jgi:plastocyanin
MVIMTSKKQIVVLSALLLVPIAFNNAFADTVTVDQCAGASDVANPCFFVPEEVTINVGDTVIWKNSDTATHTVTSGTVEAPDRWGEVFDSGLGKPGSEFRHTFDTPGEYPYLCQLHSWMKGKVTVMETPVEEPAKPGATVDTKTGRYSVQLIATPAIIQSPTTAKFYITFFQGVTQAIDKNIVYDFAVVKDGQKIVEKRQVRSLSGDSVQEVQFARGQFGTFTVKIENIHYVTEPPDPTNDNATFAIEVISPEVIEEQGMPLMMQRTAKGGFQVEVVFLPRLIEPGKTQSFALSFFNAETDFVERMVFYDFIIEKDGNKLIERKGQLAPTGTNIEKFTFNEEQTGPVTIRIDNVRLLGGSADSGENARFSINVVPEFPLGIMLIATSAIAAIILVGRFKKLPHL